MTTTDESVHRLRERVAQLEAELKAVRKHRSDLYLLVERIESLTHRALTEPSLENP